MEKKFKGYAIHEVDLYASIYGIYFISMYEKYETVSVFKCKF